MPLWKSLPDGQMEESVQLAPQTKMSFITMIENGLFNHFRSGQKILMSVALLTESQTKIDSMI